MNRKELTFSFRDPNTKEETREILIRLLIEQNQNRAKRSNPSQRYVP